MIYITGQERAIARDCMLSFRGHFDEEFRNRLLQIPYYQPTRELVEMDAKLSSLQIPLDAPPLDAAGSLDDALLPAFKRILMEYRWRIAEEIQQYKDRTIHPELLEKFELNLEPLDNLIRQDWFERVTR